MSDNRQPHADNAPHVGAHEAHTGPITNPKQLLIAVFFSFVVPIFAIIGLVYFVVSGFMPAGTADADSMALGGVTQESRQQAIASRIQKVGAVEIRDANRPARGGEDVFKAACTACHTAGVAGAPKLGDAAAWGARIQQGFDTLLLHALKGKGAMPPQGGGDFSDQEVGNAVAYMANAAGAKFEAPKVPTAAASSAAAPASAAGGVDPATAAALAQVQAAKAGTAVPAAPVTVAAAGGGGAGEALYKQACQVCHAAGVAGAPKFGDKALWAPRIKTGLEALVASAIHGKGAMPPKGGTSASDADVRAAVEYMVNASR